MGHQWYRDLPQDNPTPTSELLRPQEIFHHDQRGERIDPIENSFNRSFSLRSDFGFVYLFGLSIKENLIYLVVFRESTIEPQSV